MKLTTGHVKEAMEEQMSPVKHVLHSPDGMQLLSAVILYTK
jgi:hypothetical protein